MDGFDGDGYNNGDRTKDFLSQPDPYSPASGYDIFNDAAYLFSGSSSVNAPRVGMAVLDLNSHGKGWPGMPGYDGLLRSGPQGGGIGGSMGPLPFASAAAVVPSAYARLAVAMEEAPRPLTPCRHPPMVAVALPCLL